MSKEVIAVDVDEVLFPFLDEFLKDYNKRYDTSHTRDNFPKYEFHDPLGLDVPRTVSLIYGFTETESHAIASPVDQSKESIRLLAEKFSLSVVTARHPKLEQVTASWLEEHYPSLFDSLTFIGYAAIMDKPRTKAEICKQIGAQALIDDSAHHILECSNQGVSGVLFGNYPWNQVDPLPPNVVRCENWPAVLSHFDLN